MIKWAIVDMLVFTSSFDIVWCFLNEAVCEVIKIDDLETLMVLRFRILK